MSKIVGIGANVCDTLITVSTYPTEDTKQKASSTVVCGGGPCATGLVAASKLGGDCGFIGNFAGDASGAFLKEDFEKYNDSTEFTDIKPGSISFSSWVVLCSDTASRTCVFDRGNVPALVLSDSQKKAIADADILMVDGNEMSAAIEGAKVARENGTKVLYDAGGLYEGVENLLPLADYIIPSEEFSLGITGCKTAEMAAKVLFEKYSPEFVIITQGIKGGILYDGKELRSYPAFPVDCVDSNGSGDVFHGAFAFATNKGFSPYKACLFSSGVSALKCTHVGARAGVPTYDETIKFLKERGVNEF